MLPRNELQLLHPMGGRRATGKPGAACTKPLPLSRMASATMNALRVLNRIEYCSIFVTFAGALLWWSIQKRSLQ